MLIEFGFDFFLNCLFLPLLFLVSQNIGIDFRSAGIFENSRLINFSSHKLKLNVEPFLSKNHVSGEPCFVEDRSIVPSVRNFVIEGVACQPPSNLRRLQATPPLQTSLGTIALYYTVLN